MEKNIRYIIGIILFIIICSMCIILYYNKDVLLKSEVKITYPDNCIETYINTELVSDICVEGRIIEERQKNGEAMWIIPITKNLTI